MAPRNGDLHHLRCVRRYRSPDCGTVDVSGTTHVMAGTYNDTWTFTGSANYNNYRRGTPTTITNMINRKNATWTTNSASKTYGDADPAPLTTGSGSGFIPADAALLTATYSRVAGENAGPPTYHITGALGPADVVANYNITNSGADFTISKANATVVVTPYSVTYDGNSHTATYTINGVNGEVGNAVGTIDVSATTHTNAGTYNNDPWTFTGGPNYNDQSGTVNDIINKADATVVVNGYTGVYDAAAHGATGSAHGVSNVDLSGDLNLGATFTDVPGVQRTGASTVAPTTTIRVARRRS